MAFEVPNLDETTERLVADAGNRLPDDDFARTSDNWKRLRTLALAVTQLHRHAMQIDDDIMPDRASGTRLARWGQILQVPRKGATGAKRSAAGRVTGTVAAAVTTGDELVLNGLRYQVNNTTVVGAGSYVDVDILAIDTGSRTKLNTGAVLSFSSAPTGLDPTVILVKDLSEDGDDEEQEGSWRARILEKLAQPEAGGKPSDYRKWAMAIAYVDAAYVWPTRGGLGTVHFAGLKDGEGSARLLNPSEIAVVQAYVDLLRPAGMKGTKCLTVEIDEQNVEVAIKPTSADSSRFDWDDSVGWTLLAWNAGTRTAQLSADRPADMQIGDRLIYVSAAAPFNTCEEIEIEDFGAGDDEVILAEHADLTAAPPLAGDRVHSGGPLVEPCRQAIKSYGNQLGPGREDTTTGFDYSDGGAEWEGTVDPSTISAIARDNDGVRAADCLVPEEPYTPENSSPDTTVDVVSFKQILVRKK
jgi:uncharacterized phage protein gp47/JayE